MTGEKIKYVGSFTYKTEKGEMKISKKFNFTDYPIHLFEYARQFCENQGYTLKRVYINKINSHI